MERIEDEYDLECYKKANEITEDDLHTAEEQIQKHIQWMK